MTPRRSLFALLMLGAVAACGDAATTSAVTTPVTAANLAGTQWRILSIAGIRVEDEGAARMAFDAGTVTGSFGCNSFSGPYSTADGLLHVTAVATTEMACLGSAGRQERSGLRQ